MGDEPLPLGVRWPPCASPATPSASTTGSPSEWSDGNEDPAGSESGPSPTTAAEVLEKLTRVDSLYCRAGPDKVCWHGRSSWIDTGSARRTPGRWVRNGPASWPRSEDAATELRELLRKARSILEKASDGLASALKRPIHAMGHGMMDWLRGSRGLAPRRRAAPTGAASSSASFSSSASVPTCWRAARTSGRRGKVWGVLRHHVAK